MTHSLTLGSLLLTGDPAFADDDHGFWFEVAAEGTEFGSPEAVTRLVSSLIADGAIVSYDSDGNRTVPVRVRVHGPTLNAVAQGEAALRRESRKANELTWQPPDEFAPPSVYVTQPSSMSVVAESGWDLDEKFRRVRTVALSLTCSPFARSAEMVTVEAMPSGSTAISVDTCDSVSGWSSTRGGSPATVVNWIAGAVGVVELDSYVTSPETWTLTRSGSVDFTSTPYLEAEIRTLSQQQGMRVAASVNGVVLPVLSSRLINDGEAFHRVTYDATGVGVASSITFTHTSIKGEPWQGVYVRQVSRTDIAPGVTARQLTRIIDPGGTERTPASIHVYSGNEFAGLGIAIVHTSPEDGSGYSPPLRRWRVAGNTPTMTGDALSGAFESLHPNAFVAEVPAQSIPKGGYALVARVISDTAGSFELFWSLGSRFPPDTGAQGQRSGRTSVHFYAANQYHLVTLAIETLPITLGDTGVVSAVIEHDSGGAAIAMDEAWLFRIDDDSALTIVDIPPAHVWLDSADLNSPQPSVWWSEEADRSDQRHPGTALLAPGAHVLHPGGTAVFTAAMVDHPETSATFYRRWHSNAAE